VISKASEQVKKSSRDSIEYLRRIKREAEESEVLRRALEEERAAVAEKFAALDKEAETHERDRQAQFEQQLSNSVAEFEKLSGALLAKIEDRAARLKVERETERRAAELKREAQRAAQAGRAKVPTQSGKPHEGNLPPQLRGVRVVRDGKVVGDGGVARGKRSESVVDERTTSAGGQDVRAPDRFPARVLRVGDRVRLRSFGSIGIVDQIKDDDAEVRVGSLHMRERLANLELVDESSISGNAAGSHRDGVSNTPGSGRARQSLEDIRRQASSTELHLHSKGGHGESATSAELNLIGKKTDEAVELTDKFLDEGFLNGLSEVRIIHGHGTGALRRAIADLLTGHPHVARFKPAPQDQGGAGATIVELNQ
jgi:DNA mismatch repair protein MutS2